MHGNDLRLFMDQAFPILYYSNYLCRGSDIAVVGTILTSLVMTQVWAEIRTYQLHDDERIRLRVEPRSRVNLLRDRNLECKLINSKKFLIIWLLMLDFTKPF